LNNSLLIGIGIFAKSGCGAGVFAVDKPRTAGKSAKFPVIFPVSREFGLGDGFCQTALATTSKIQR
jgi:hypothetical protein